MLIVFDLDGTLVDSRADIIRATNFALRQHGRPPLPDAVVTSFVGDGARTLVARATQLAEDDTALEPYLQAFLDYYTEHAAVHTRPMPGAIAVLEALSGELPLALCTNKPRRTTLAVLQALRLGGYFVSVCAGGDHPEKKPHPAPLLALCARLGFAAASTVMVGDGPQDIESGRRAGTRTVGIVGNIAPADVLAQQEPGALLASIRDLPALLRRWRSELPAHATSR